MHNRKQLILNHCLYVLSWANVGPAMPALGAWGWRFVKVATRTCANIPHYIIDSEDAGSRVRSKGHEQGLQRVV